jgi:hypothetical protein
MPRFFNRTQFIQDVNSAGGVYQYAVGTGLKPDVLQEYYNGTRNPYPITRIAMAVLKGFASNRY